MAKKMAMMDWRAMKYYHVRWFLVPLMVAFVGVLSSSLLVMPTSVLLFMFFSLNPFAVEEKGALNNLYLTLPVTRNAIVHGRYLLAGIMGLAGVVVSIPIMVLVNAVAMSRYYLPLSWHVFILAVSYLAFALMNLAIFPLLFKLGYCKGKFWGLILPAIFMGVLYGAFTLFTYMPGNEAMLFNILEFASQNMLLVSGGVAVLATGVLLLSITLSKRIYAKRDF